MRLLIVLTSLCAEGTPILVLQLCEHWQKQGLEIHIVTLQPTPLDLAPEFSALGIPITNFSLGQGYGRYPRLLSQTYRHCLQFKPDAVLSMPLGWHAFIAWGAKVAGVKKVCAHVGNLPPVWTGAAFQKFKLQVQLGRPVTDRLLCCSEYIRQATVRDFKVSTAETATIYNACNLEKFKNLPRPDNLIPVIAMVARLEGHKDQPTLIKATAILKKEGIQILVRLIGEGSKRTELEQLIHSLDLTDQITLLGMRRDIPEQLSQMDLFIFAAKPDEGFGIALAEAMAAGVPIVATDVGACREVLQDGRCGLPVKAGDPQALADGIAQVLGDRQTAQEKAKLAKERALTDFGIATMADRYLAELSS
ncbi:glycosyltransferase [Synechocystis sp. PCC 7338]|uniref:glycosyltransferase n=1 Tax=Synechocystis sp. PCC 7338 TaxID=2732530 RepID=UPI001BAFA2B7|nr:glycosyltransferase [Synechocystis sp. PCC 7338]QUS59980.1 glycosyltransferase [Synechocystis sp. PCC 7338]